MGLSELQLPSAFPKIHSQVALKLLQIRDFAANLNEFVFQQVSDDFTRIAATVPQIEKLFDLLQGEAQTLHLFDKVESGHVVGGVEAKPTRCSWRRGQQGATLVESESCRLSVRFAVLRRRFGLRR